MHNEKLNEIFILAYRVFYQKHKVEDIMSYQVRRDDLWFSVLKDFGCKRPSLFSGDPCAEEGYDLICYNHTGGLDRYLLIPCDFAEKVLVLGSLPI